MPLEFYLGTTLGFLLASLMLNASSGWLAGIYPIPVLVMSLVGFGVGKIRQKIWTKTIVSQHYLKYRRWIFFLLIWPLCVFGPYCGMKTYYWIKATTLPVPPGWTRTSVQTTVLGWDNGAGFRIQIEGHGENEALHFYRQYFEREGWTDQSHRWIMSSDPDKNTFTYGKARSHTRICFGIVQWEFNYRTKQGYPIEYQPSQKRVISVSYMN